MSSESFTLSQGKLVLSNALPAKLNGIVIYRKLLNFGQLLKVRLVSNLKSFFSRVHNEVHFHIDGPLKQGLCMKKKKIDNLIRLHY